VLHIVLISAQIDHLDDLGTLLGNLPMFLLALRRIRVVDVLAAGDLLQVLVEPDYLVLGLCRLSTYLLPLLMENLIAQGPLAVVLDTGWGRQELAQGRFPAI
jgi:hypothetical protein